MRYPTVLATLALVSVPLTAKAQAPWCSDQTYALLTKADTLLWQAAERNADPVLWARYYMNPSGCQQKRAAELLKLVTTPPTDQWIEGRASGTNETKRYPSKLTTSSHIHHFRIHLKLDVPKSPFPSPLPGKGLYVVFQCDWEPALGGSTAWKDSSDDANNTCGHLGDNDTRVVKQVRFEFKGTLLKYFDARLRCFEGSNTNEVACDRPGSAGLHGLTAIEVVVTPKKQFLEYLHASP